MRAIKFIAVLFASMPFLWSPALSQCPKPTKALLTPVTLEQVKSDEPEGGEDYKSVEIHAFNINCLAAASTRGYYQEALVTVNFTVPDTSVSKTFQMVLSCTSEQEWESLQSVSLPREFDGKTQTAKEALNYETDVSCISCRATTSPNHPSHCTTCEDVGLNECNVGSMSCYIDGSTLRCCNFYDKDGKCLAECGENEEPASNYTCVCSGTTGPSGECISPPLESIESVVITAQPGFQVKLGGPLNLTCTVVATGLEEITWEDETGLTDTDRTAEATDISTGVSTLTIHAVSAADLGRYTCEAMAGTIMRNTSATITTSIEIKSSVSPKDEEPFYSGTELTLFCTINVSMIVDEHIDFLTQVDVSYQRNGISTSSDTRVTATGPKKLDSSPDTRMYESQITISPLVQSYDAGEWACKATSANPFIIVRPVTDSFVLAVQLSTPSASVDPTSVEVPETYNEDIVLVCMGTVPRDLVVDKEITWFVDGEEIHDGVSSLTSPRGMTSISNITLASPRNVGVYNYTCHVTVSVTGDPIQSAESMAQITITEAFKECTIQSPLTVIPNRNSGTMGTPYNFHGTCEHILTAPCDSEAYKVVGDFLQSNLSTGRVGLVLPGYTAIIDEGLNLIEEGDKPKEVITAQQPDDVKITLFDGSNVVLSIERTDDQIVVMSTVGSSDLCGLCGDEDGFLNSSSGQRVTDIMDRMQIETFASSWKVEPSEQILREDRRECADIRSDTVVGDPLLQVPLWMKDSDEIRSLCYEVHGRSDAYFNLVSDECIIVNALYAQIGDFNVVSEIGVRAVTNSEENCIAVKVAQVNNSCSTTLTFTNGTDFPMSVGEMYSQDGIQVRQQNQYRVRISVPNCEQVDLVMWATCEFNEGMPMMHFNISRGVNLRSTSHGLLGQFWNIPVTAEKVTDPALLQRLPQEYYKHDKIYVVTVQPASSPDRTFIGELLDRHWDSYKSPCMYSGNSQAGPAGEMHGLDHSVIEGRYTDYIVSNIFNADFPYNKFDDGKCSGT